MELEIQILGFIGALLDIDINEELIDVNLITLGIDSIKFISLVVTLEDEFDIEIPDNYLLIQEMDTPKKIITIVEKLLQPK